MGLFLLPVVLGQAVVVHRSLLQPGMLLSSPLLCGWGWGSLQSQRLDSSAAKPTRAIFLEAET
jgi:hypothetical protein